MTSTSTSTSTPRHHVKIDRTNRQQYIHDTQFVTMGDIPDKAVRWRPREWGSTAQLEEMAQDVTQDVTQDSANLRAKSDWPETTEESAHEGEGASQETKATVSPPSHHPVKPPCHSHQHSSLAPLRWHESTTEDHSTENEDQTKVRSNKAKLAAAMYWCIAATTQLQYPRALEL